MGGGKPGTLRWLMFGLYGKFFAVALWRGACYAGAGASPAPYNGLCLFCTGNALRLPCRRVWVSLVRGQAPHPTMAYVWFVRVVPCGCLLRGGCCVGGGGAPHNGYFILSVLAGFSKTQIACHCQSPAYFVIFTA